MNYKESSTSITAIAIALFSDVGSSILQLDSAVRLRHIAPKLIGQNHQEPSRTERKEQTETKIKTGLLFSRIYNLMAKVGEVLCV